MPKYRNGATFSSGLHAFTRSVAFDLARIPLYRNGMHEEARSPLPKFLYAFAALMLGLRFLWLGDTVYILDEAFLQIRIDEHLAAGTIPFSNSRGSSIPLPYGPGGLWFYMLIRQISWLPIVNVVAHLLVQLVGFFFFARALQKLFGRDAAAWCTALAASSPLLFFFARHPWDNTLLIPITGILLWLLQKLEEGGSPLWIHLALGLVAGYGLNTHLMFGPVFVGLTLLVLYRNFRAYGWRSHRFYLYSALFGACALLVLTPYLVEAFRIARAEQPFENARNKSHWGDARNLWWIFLRTTLFSSLFGARAHLDDLRPVFYTYAGKIPAAFFKVDYFGWFGKLAAWSLAFSVLANVLRGRGEESLVKLFACFAFFTTLLVYQYLNIPMAAHYFNPVWWFVFIGIGAAILRLAGWWKRLFLATLAATMVVNVMYISLALAFIHENKGARNMEQSVAVSEQMRLMRELCAWGKSQGKPAVRIDKSAVALGEPAFDYLPAHMPECQGVKLTLVPERTEADFRLRYSPDSSTSAALFADPAKQP